MVKIIKEIILLLLVCLVGMLLFAVIFYQYIPSRKVIEPIKTYVASKEIQELLSDTIDEEETEIIKHYEITSGDLTNYQIIDEYVPGKSNPFAKAADDVKPSDENGSGTGSSIGSSSSSSSESSNKNEVYIRPSGTK